MGFNPCFSGCRSESSYLKGEKSAKLCFNPCFSGCRSERNVSPEDVEAFRSFNPCFSGCRSERQNRNGWCYLERFVSILVFLDVALKDVAESNSQNRNGVSILVFLDVALKAILRKMIGAPTRCFNPCFSGCRSESSSFDLQFRAL